MSNQMLSIRRNSWADRNGRIVQSGGPEVAIALEEGGYKAYGAVEASTNGTGPD